MTTVSSDLLNSMNVASGPAAASTTGSAGLTDSTPEGIQNRFLKLLTAQMKNQDPNNPMDNAQMTSQMAQLSTVSGVSQLNNTLSTLLGNLNSSQSLQSADMIGRSVLAPGSNIDLHSESSKAADGTTTTTQKSVLGVKLDGSASTVTVTIKDSSGAVVRTLDLGNQPAGSVPVVWDGSTDAGGKARDGAYSFSVNAANAGVAVNATPLSFGTVTSVSTTPDGIKLNVSNIGTVKPAEVLQIL